MGSKLRFLLLTGLLLVLLGTRFPALAAYLQVNLGSLAMIQLAAAGSPLHSGPHQPVAQPILQSARAARSIAYFKTARDLLPFPRINRLLGRAALLYGDHALAHEVLLPLANDCTTDALLYQDLVLALGETVDPFRLLSFYETCPAPFPTLIVSDTVAFAYDKAAQQLIERGGRRVSAELLSRVVALRPADLYANYHLWSESGNSSETTGQVLAREKLIHFPVEALRPAEPRLVDLAAEIIPNLIMEGVWDQDTAVHVVRYLLSRYPERQSIDALIEKLLRHDPGQATWWFARGELLHRRGDYSQALVNYREALALDPAYVEAHLRIGLLCERHRESCPQHGALDAYQVYHQAVPGDLFGAIRLLEASEEAGASTSPMLREEVHLQMDLHRQVSLLTRSSPDSFELGPDLLVNGGFEQWQGDRPVGWLPLNHTTGDIWWNRGAFVGGRDELLPFDGNAAAVVSGFWGLEDKRRSPAQYGYLLWNEQTQGVAQVPLARDKLYLLRLVYKTEGSKTGGFAVGVQQIFSPEVDPATEYLPHTGGEWRQYARVICNSRQRALSLSISIKSLARGRVWFDSVQLVEIRATRPFTCS